MCPSSKITELITVYANDSMSQSQCLAALLSFLLKRPFPEAVSEEPALWASHDSQQMGKENPSCSRVPETDYVIKERGSWL